MSPPFEITCDQRPKIILTHPVKKYTSNVKNTILIESDGVHAIELSFSELSMERCYDYVTITFDGYSISFPECCGYHGAGPNSCHGKVELEVLNWIGYAIGDVEIVTSTDNGEEEKGYELNWKRIPAA